MEIPTYLDLNRVSEAFKEERVLVAKTSQGTWRATEC